MNDCPTCEYHKQRAQLWRDEAYRLAGHPLPERDPVLEEREACAKVCEEYETNNDIADTWLNIVSEVIRARGTPTVINLPKIPLYTAPTQRTWVNLTDDEMLMIYGQNHEGKKYNLGRMVQQALKEKNT